MLLAQLALALLLQRLQVLVLQRPVPLLPHHGLLVLQVCTQLV
jgi:hypothetical protein